MPGEMFHASFLFVVGGKGERLKCTEGEGGEGIEATILGKFSPFSSGHRRARLAFVCFLRGTICSRRSKHYDDVDVGRLYHVASNDGCNGELVVKPTTRNAHTRRPMACSMLASSYLNDVRHLLPTSKLN
ncbi:hypothetical protein ZHAS_00006688 [Anopheles sinensis]|uniref:Uncharacterized protein n=1 Tax=Anopheles sinensis TaxID=74873 RepID=A0A084VMY6_ANOSI|nr:hypothetical protein ZHAS_00006688 [Anopheles sinensis]